MRAERRVGSEMEEVLAAPLRLSTAVIRFGFALFVLGLGIEHRA